MITYSNIGRYGRFGNQMFQYAALFGIAKTAKYRYGVPYNNKSENEYEHFCLTEAFDKLEAENSEGQPIKYRIAEPKFGYNPGLFGIPDHSDIVGYFQTEKYFVDYRPHLLKQFSFRNEIKEQAENIRAITKDRVISLHIRLGDYVNQQQNHPVYNIDYYNSALDLLPDDVLLMIFSDDVAKAQTIFEPLKRKMVFPETNNKYIDMCLMSMCDYHIIANSSFSWWGAWLSESKKIIAPSQWFGNGPDMPKNWSDVYCKGWVVI
jgi:uncharacterized membrane protein YkvA (DUF1232 family)